jgi:hypothetical protein
MKFVGCVHLLLVFDCELVVVDCEYDFSRCEQNETRIKLKTASSASPNMKQSIFTR